MLVKIARPDRAGIFLPIPLVLAKPIVDIILKEEAIKRNSAPYLSREQVTMLFSCLRQCRKDFPGLVLVDIRSKEGEKVQIKL